MKRASLLIALALLAALGGCMRPSPPPVPYDPYPYSFHDAAKSPYPQSLYGAQRFVADARALWSYQTNTGVQLPQDSERWMSGDCDDFAVMLAYYLQQFWRYDTFIILLEIANVGRHACAFVAGSSGVVSTGVCLAMPIVRHPASGETYYPLDWTECPQWMWTNLGGPASYEFEWYQLAGHPTMDVSSATAQSAP